MAEITDLAKRHQEETHRGGAVEDAIREDKDGPNIHLTTKPGSRGPNEWLKPNK